jgi:hypothetical protein
MSADQFAIVQCEPGRAPPDSIATGPLNLILEGLAGNAEALAR